MSRVTCFCPERDQILVTASTVTGGPEQARGGGGEVGGCGELKVFIHLLIILSCHPTYTLLPAYLVAQHCGVPGDVGPDGQHTVRAETGEPRARAVKLGHGHFADWPGGSPYMQYLYKI